MKKAARDKLYSLVAIVALLLYWEPLLEVWRASLQADHYSHIPLIPLISGFLVWWDRKRIF